MHFKNRSNRSCANVGSYLNYTKLNYFTPDELAETVRMKAQKPGLSRDLHTSSQQGFTTGVQEKVKPIVMSP